MSLPAGAERLVSQEEARGREGRGHRLPGHPGGGEDRRPAEGDDRVAAAAGEGALGADDTGGSGGGAGGPGESPRCRFYVMGQRCGHNFRHHFVLGTTSGTELFPAGNDSGYGNPNGTYMHIAVEREIWINRC